MEKELITKNKLFRIFLIFLRENDALYKFLNNLKNKSIDNFGTFITYDMYFERVKKGMLLKNQFLSSAFPWSISKEGVFYWKDLHAKWINTWLCIGTDECCSPRKYVLNNKALILLKHGNNKI